MSQSWLGEECRQQAILFLAAEVYRGSRGAGKKTRGCPPPLLTADSPLRSLLEKRARDDHRSGSVQGLGERVGEMFREHGSDATGGIPSTPWTRAELVGWWLDAGAVLKELSSQQRDALARETQGDVDCLHPALWCAERFARVSLCPEVFRRNSQTDDWRTMGNGPSDYKRKLFVWVMSPDRERPAVREMKKGTPGWITYLTKEMRTIGEDAVALFGKNTPLQVGNELTLARTDKWIAVWTESRVGNQLVHEIRRPVSYPAPDGGSRSLVKGVAVLPPAETLCGGLASLPPPDGWNTGGPGSKVTSLLRATAFACSRWPPNNVVSNFWAKAGSDSGGVLRVAQVESAFLAVARWLTSAHVAVAATASPPLPENMRDLVEAMQIGLGLEGFRVREGREGQLPTREIPQGFETPAERLGLFFEREASEFRIPIGYVGEPASCTPELFAAIEAVDWRLWALQAAPQIAVNEPGSLAVKVLDMVRQRVVQGETWEAVKRQALHTSGSDSDAEALAELFQYAHERRMTLNFVCQRAYGDQRAEGILAGLLEEYERLAQVSLARLAAIDPATLGRLEPPRCADGAIDLRAWLSRGGPVATAKVPYRLRWCHSSQPRGEILHERRSGSAFEAVISAGDVADTELAMLNAPLVGTSPRENRDDAACGLSQLLADLKTDLIFPPPGHANLPGWNPVAKLRSALDGEAAAAFHELISCFLAGDEAAITWCRIMRSAPQFDFACHPGIDFENGCVRPPSADAPFLSWEFDATVPAGHDLATTFAMTPAAAQRVISLGPRQTGSPADRADQLAVTCHGAGESLGRLGKEALRATHRWLAFGAEVPHPIGVAARLLDALLVVDDAPPSARADVYRAVGAWCETIDHVLQPSEWRPQSRLQPSAFAGLDLPADFDDTVSTGAVVIRRFGLRGMHGRPFVGAVSAGPAPPGFHVLRAAVDGVGSPAIVGAVSRWDEVARRVDELAKHSLAGTLPLALPNLFDCLWEVIAVTEHTEALGNVQQTISPLLEMLKATCRMVVFEPTTVGEYSAGWIREAGGSQPRGRRIKQLVRPGLRTVDNLLVRPAIVVTE